MKTNFRDYLKAAPKYVWSSSHNRALTQHHEPCATAWLKMFEGLHAYCRAYHNKQKTVADDSYCGRYVLKIYNSLAHLLNSPIGELLDAGTLSAGLYNLMVDAGFTDDDL